MARKTSLQPVQRAASLGERVYHLLREHLHSGRVRPGEPLREVTLAAELGVSRTPVREALARLASEGLVEVNGRSFVAPALTGGDLQDIYELRLLLETEAARQVARRTDIDAELVQIREALALAGRAHAQRNADAFIDANRRFRAAWLSLVPNRRLERAVEIYAAHVRALQFLTLRDPQRQKAVLRGMRDIHRALGKRDPEEAAAAMRRYLGIARTAMQQAAGQMTDQAKVA
jgi:DNA-binding GntR family transcriptional regulator